MENLKEASRERLIAYIQYLTDYITTLQFRHNDIENIESIDNFDKI